MSIFLAGAIIAVIGYLIGSVNTAIIISKAVYKDDVRNHGSGNAGMTNMGRSFGKKSGIIVLFLDIAKSAIAGLIGMLLFPVLFAGAVPLVGAYIACYSAVFGHAFPIYHGFRGGKGVATSGGAIVALEPLSIVFSLGLFLVSLKIKKMVSVSSIVLVVVYDIFVWIYRVAYLGQSVFYGIAGACLALFVIVLHKDNIKRIIAGNENKIGSKKAAKS